MSRVAADTNIFISAFMFGGLPASFLDLALAQQLVLVTSAVLLDELDDKLRTKFKVAPEDADLIRSRVETAALIVEPAMTLAVIADDPDDDQVLECAVAGKADCIVSGDRHLLKLGSYERISILTVRQFMDAMEVGF